MNLRRIALTAVTALLSAAGLVATSNADAPDPPFISSDAPWLQSVNYFRQMAGLPAVVENAAWSAGDYNHACYMLQNGMSHDETPDKIGYTTDGDTAGNASNVAVNSTSGVPARDFVELWMTGPFHAIGVLRHNLRTVGYGQCENTSTPTWHSGRRST